MTCNLYNFHYHPYSKIRIEGIMVLLTKVEIKMSNDRTIYSITDELKRNSTISLFKPVADFHQKISGNVHVLMQQTYNEVTKDYPNLSRRKRGDLVRYHLTKKATNNPIYLELLNQYL